MPWSFDEALERHGEAKTAQHETGEEIVRAYREYGKAQKLYAVALARRIFELKSQGVAVTACETLAKGDEQIAALREARDIAEGLRESAKVAAWAANKDREELARLIDWSFRRELAEGYAS